VCVRGVCGVYVVCLVLGVCVCLSLYVYVSQ